MTRKIPLADWVSSHYDPAPSPFVYRKWVRDGQIYPPPEKVGKHYYVQEDARRITEGTPTGPLAEFLAA
jgi:hypothetical protein